MTRPQRYLSLLKRHSVSDDCGMDPERRPRRPAHEWLTEALHEQIEQDLARGDWPSLRGRPMPEQPPWPDPDSATLNYLVEDALADIEDGKDPRSAITHAVVFAWMESAVANYDRGQRDARAQRS